MRACTAWSPGLDETTYKSTPIAPLSGALPWVLPCLLALAYLAICASYGGADRAAVVCSDTLHYEGPASHFSPFSLDFYTASRPFSTLWLFRIAHGSHGLVVVFQIVIAACCWLALAATLPRLFRSRWVKLVAMLLPLMLSLAWPIQTWNYLLLSESLCFSLLAAVIAVGILVFHSNRPHTSLTVVVAWGFLFLVWGGTRDTVTYSIAVAAVGLLCWSLVLLWNARRPARRACPHCRLPARGPAFLVPAGLFLLVLAGSLNWLAERSGRWKANVLNSIDLRILSDTAAREEWVRELGMPDSPRLREFTGKFFWDHVGNEPREIQDIVILNPAASGDGLRGFPAWLSQRGLHALRSHLLRHPVQTIAAAVAAYAELPQYLPEEEAPWKLAGPHQWERPAISKIATMLFFPALGQKWMTALRCVVLLLAFAWCCAGRRWAPLAWSLVLLLNTFVQIESGYHGDAHGVGRHTLLAGILLRLSAIVIFCGAADGWLAKMREWARE